MLKKILDHCGCINHLKNAGHHGWPAKKKFVFRFSNMILAVLSSILLKFNRLERGLQPQLLGSDLKTKFDLRKKSEINKSSSTYSMILLNLSNIYVKVWSLLWCAFSFMHIAGYVLSRSLWTFLSRINAIFNQLNYYFVYIATFFELNSNIQLIELQNYKIT